MNSRRLMWIVSFGLLAGLVTGCGTPVAKVGAKSPSFSLPTLQQTSTTTLRSLLQSGNPVIVNTFASWCGPCQQETPDLEQLAKAYKGKVTVIGIDMTTTDSVQAARTFVQKYHVTYPVLLDTKGKFLKAYQVAGFPTTFLLDGHGTLLEIVPGRMTTKQMRALFQTAVQHTS